MAENFFEFQAIFGRFCKYMEDNALRVYAKTGRFKK
jgi:hypothetical protein